jgi:hypothetical protein
MDRNGGLRDDRPFIHFRAHEMNRAAGHLDPFFQHPLMNMQALEGRQQRWVNIDQAVAPAVDKPF